MTRDDDATLAIRMLVDIVRAPVANGPPLAFEPYCHFLSIDLDGGHSVSVNAHIFAHLQRQVKLKCANNYASNIVAAVFLSPVAAEPASRRQTRAARLRWRPRPSRSAREGARIDVG